jgi:hypothetical protein
LPTTLHTTTIACARALLARQHHHQPAFLKLRLRPSDPYSHPLLGEVQAQEHGLLLRIARPRQQQAQGGGAAGGAAAMGSSAAPAGAAPRVSVAARVTRVYAFNGMADYQVRGGLRRRGRQAWQECGPQVRVLRHRGSTRRTQAHGALHRVCCALLLHTVPGARPARHGAPRTPHAAAAAAARSA